MSWLVHQTTLHCVQLCFFAAVLSVLQRVLVWKIIWQLQDSRYYQCKIQFNSGKYTEKTDRFTNQNNAVTEKSQTDEDVK